MTDRMAAPPAKLCRPDVGQHELHKAHDPEQLLCIGPQGDGRRADAAMRFIAGRQIIKQMYHEIMSNPDFDKLRANVQDEHFLKTTGRNLSPLQLFKQPPGVCVFLTHCVPDASHPDFELPRFAAINAFKRVLHAGHGDASFLDGRDCTNEKAAARVFAELRLRHVEEVCQLMVRC